MEIFQETMTDFYMKPEMPENVDPLPYLTGFAKVVISRMLEANEKRAKSDLQLRNQDENIFEPRYTDTKELAIIAKSLKELINKLPPSFRRILEEVTYTDKNREDICKELNLKSMNVFNSILSQSRRRLLEVIDKSSNYSILKENIERLIKRNGKRKH